MEEVYKRQNPSFEEFNKPTLVNQPFKWDDKLYLMPVWSRSDMDELYSNPQLVQALKYLSIRIATDTIILK